MLLEQKIITDLINFNYTLEGLTKLLNFQFILNRDDVSKVIIR